MSPLTTTGIATLVLDGAHRRPIGAALVELAAGAAMHGDHLHARRRGAARQLGRVDRAIIPAEPHLERHRHRHGADGGLDQRQRMVEIAHQRRAGLPAGHVARRATHIDVDNGGAGILGDASAFRHPAGLAAGELHDVEPDALPLGAQQRIGMALCEVIARRHLGDHEAGAKPGGQPPERRIGYARHGRQDHAVRQGEIADGDRERAGIRSQ